MSEERFVEDIGMFALDRPLSSCSHATNFCRENCYNLKFYKMFDLTEKDKRLEKFWQRLDGGMLKKILSRKRRDTSRFRFCTRGEPFSELSDVDKVRDIALENPGTVFWIPTRGWRDDEIKKAVEEEVLPLDNTRVLASVDPSTSEGSIEVLKDGGWSTMFFGDDSAVEGRVKCPKTWLDETGFCSECEKGCFSESRVDVHLKQH